MLNGHQQVACSGLKGFDCNTVLSDSQIQAFVRAGYKFVCRYVKRSTVHSGDLTASEAARILQGGLGLMAVQHVDLPGWRPSASLGVAYGQGAVEHMQEIGFPAGSMVWLDLEGVAPGTPHMAVRDYCKSWHQVAAASGFLPGIYVGYQPGLTASELYYGLPFTHYWAAYNLDGDQEPVVRGCQMRQRAKKSPDVPRGVDLDFDVNEIRPDKLGGVPQILASQGWVNSLVG